MNNNKIDMRDAFFYSLLNEAKKNDNIIFLTDDHGAFALNDFKKAMPNQFINIGIAEQNLVGLASGLSKIGKIVFCYGISPFVSTRVLEQITLDLALMKANVSIISVGSGFTYSTDGPSHHGLQDLSALLTVPNIVVLNSSDPVSTGAFAKMASKENSGPFYIRIEKGFFDALDRVNHKSFSDGLSSIAQGSDLTIISTGSIIEQAKEARLLLEEKLNIDVGLIDLYRLKPLPEKQLFRLLSKTKRIVTIEENYLTGGMGSLVVCALNDAGVALPAYRIGVKEKYYFNYGDRDYLLRLCGLNGEAIASQIEEWISNG